MLQIIIGPDSVHATMHNSPPGSAPGSIQKIRIRVQEFELPKNIPKQSPEKHLFNVCVPETPNKLEKYPTYV